jgi:hypothetical protein
VVRLRGWFDAGDARVILGNLFQLLDDDVKLFRERVEKRQLNVQFAFPEFIGLALGQWFTERVDAFAPRVPGFLTRVDGDAMIDEPGPDGVLDLVDSLNQESCDI